MKRSNVAKFLRGHGVEPFAMRAEGGQLWLRADVEAAFREYNADGAKRDADARRRATARGERATPRRVARPEGNGKPPRRTLGATQRRALELLSHGPLTASQFEDANAMRLAFLRLEERGLVASDDGRPRVYRLTAEGRVALEESR